MQVCPVLRRAALLCLLPALFGACDRHSAGEPPESYGHGSSRQKSYTNHSLDAAPNSQSFSDTVGESADKKSDAAPESPTPQRKRLNSPGH